MLLERATLRVAAAIVLAGCASTSAPPAPKMAAPSPASAPAPEAPQAASADRASTTGLTGAVVSSNEAPPQAGWTDDRILMILVASNEADLEQAELAGERARDVRITRYAEHLRNDDNVLGQRARELADRFGKRDSAERLEIDVEHGGFLVAMRDAPPENFDDVFLKAQIEQGSSLLRLIDEQLLPAAKDADVVALLRETRAGTAYHLSVARSIRVGSVHSLR